MNDFKNFIVNETYWSSLFFQIACDVPCTVGESNYHWTGTTNDKLNHSKFNVSI